MSARLWTTMGLLGLLAGCEAAWKCPDFCAEAQKCPNKRTTQDCAAICGSADKVNAETGCGIEWDALIECEQSHAGQICTETACGNQYSDWGLCSIDYCMQHMIEEPVCITDAFVN